MSNQYDEIKELLKNSRRMTSDLLKEEEGSELTPEEQKREEEDFRRAVSDRVKFGKIKIYESGGLPKVEWMGELIRERMEFVFSLDDTVGCYISADLLQLRDDTLKTLEKLRAYYDGWAKKWSEETSTEFEEMEETGEEETDFDSMGVGADIGDFDDEIDNDVNL
jgi:regulator of RNase E activity RraB